MQLAFGSLDLRDSTGIFLDIVRGFYEPAETRGEDVTIPSRVGRAPMNRMNHKRTILMVGRVTGTDAADFLSNMLSLQAACDAGVIDTLTVDDGYLGTGSTAYTIEARYLNMSVSDLQKGPVYATVSCEFESVVPDWTATP